MLLLSDQLNVLLELGTVLTGNVVAELPHEPALSHPVRKPSNIEEQILARLSRQLAAIENAPEPSRSPFNGAVFVVGVVRHSWRGPGLARLILGFAHAIPAQLVRPPENLVSVVHLFALLTEEAEGRGLSSGVLEHVAASKEPLDEDLLAHFDASWLVNVGDKSLFF